jgi:hypothetical protein
MMVKNGNLTWWNLLQEVEASRNSSYHRVIRASPDQVYFEKTDNPAIHAKAQQDRQELMDKYKQSEFVFGDKVFCATSVIYSHARQKIKAGQGKDLVVKHVPVQLRVTKVVLPSDKIVERRSYQLAEWYSPYRKLYAVKVGADAAKRYTLAKVYASALIKSTLPYQHLSISLSQHLKMNGVEKRSSDLVCPRKSICYPR